MWFQKIMYCLRFLMPNSLNDEVIEWMNSNRTLQFDNHTFFYVFMKMQFTMCDNCEQHVQVLWRNASLRASHSNALHRFTHANPLESDNPAFSSIVKIGIHWLDSRTDSNGIRIFHVNVEIETIAEGEEWPWRWKNNKLSMCVWG